jgi:two-component system CheB/CheR fusion protein
MARSRMSDDKKTASPASRKTSGPLRTSIQPKDVLASFPVVGIGASAGGLTAVTQLLKYLPPEIGIAVVVIQHLDPKHGSLTADILSRACPMPVAEVQDGMQIERGRVYVIPPNRNLRLSKGILELSPRIEARGQHLPIDFFFQSLASEKKDLAVGVVLSGIASDGTLGLRAIKAEGGVTFAQDPKTAQYDGMPRSAILSGAVDIINTPKGIAEEIGRIAQLLPAQPVSVVEEKRGLGRQGQFRKIFTVLRIATGIDFTYYKQSTIQRRIGRRQFLLKIPDLQNYAKYLADHPEEVTTLVEDLLIQVTSFFRDPEAFDFLKAHILPKCIQDPDRNVPIRIWVPGCSTGEEAYSIAMVFLELLEKAKDRPEFQIFASDISEQAIQKARRGVYPENITKDVSKVRLRRFFERTEGGYRIAKPVRDTCLFSKQDVANDPPFAKIDLISCRNVLIYFTTELQKRVLPILHYSLKPGGILWLGRSETIGQFSNLFAVEDRTNKFYSKKQITTPVKIDFPVGHQVPEALAAARRKMPESTPTLEDVQREADRVALAEYAPPGVVINDAHEILQVRGRPAPYVELTSGQASLNVFKLARPEIVSDLRYLVNAARRQNKPVKKDLLVLNDDRRRAFGIRVVPLRLPMAYKERCFSIFFEEAAALTQPEPPASKANRKQAQERKQTASDRIARQQIEDNQKYQQALIEEYETTQEELTSANEELQSTNEELQSTNEELETAKEELQSANEEMTTVNEELQTRNSEMNQLSNDLTNILASVDIPIVMVGQDGRIRSFTPKAGQILKLLANDVGRPIGDIKSSIEAVDLDELTSSVMTTTGPREVEAQDKQGTWYRLQVKPYRTLENKIDGAVVALIDITALKHGADKLRSVGEDAMMIMETTPIPIMVITPDRRVQAANQSFCETFRIERSQSEGRFLSELGAGQWNIPSLLKMLEAVLNNGEQYKGFELELDFPAVGHKSLLINARRSYLAGSGMQVALFAIEDITARKGIARQLEKTEARYRNLLENARDGIVVINKAGTIEFANHQAEAMFGYSTGELNHQPYEVLIPDQFRESHRVHHAAFVANPDPRDMGRNVDLYAKRKDGGVFPVDISLSPITHDSEVLVTAIIHDISERKKLETERQRILSSEKQARLEAEEANRVKDEFLATLSHELRTPLSTILSWAQLLRLGETNPEKTKKGIAVIEKSAHAQGQLIGDLLDVSRIQSGKLHLEFSTVDPAECVSAVVDSVRSLAEEKAISIVTEFDRSCGKISADSDRLQQALRNLLTNAIKFTPRKGKITVRLNSIKEPSHEWVRIQVEDTGKGINAELLPLLFTRFKQADSSATREFGGLGLGLSIVRHLVDMHGGTVKAESPGEGKGSVFTVTLPCQQARSGETTEKYVSKQTANERSALPARLDGLRILVVEDDEATRDGFAVMLQSLGASVRTTASAAEGFEALAEFKPDVLLCDVAMPGEDGYSLARRIRKLKPRQGGKTPSIALTAYVGTEDVRRAHEAQFDMHIAKPADMVSLSYAIANLAKHGK